jgi:hypothetical protein
MEKCIILKKVWIIKRIDDKKGRILVMKKFFNEFKKFIS